MKKAEQLRTELSKLLREARGKTGRTMKEAARESRISVDVLRKAEHGISIPAMKTMYKLSAYYEIDIDILSEFVLENPYSHMSRNASLCWACANSVPDEMYGCPWSDYGKPVAGWKITRSCGSSCIVVRECPMFKEG